MASSRNVIQPPPGPNGVSIPPLTAEEDEALIYTRLTNDERPLRRVLKKFHNYTTASQHASSLLPPIPQPDSQSDDGDALEIAREAFLVELASFQLTLKKSVMICEAEARQVEEYQRERQRIEDEHGKLGGQIEQLKTSLEHAQMSRRQKIEYDTVAEKVNTLPTREELELSLQELENDMVAIRAEHENQARNILGQKDAIDGVIVDLSAIRSVPKESEASSHPASPAIGSLSLEDTPAPTDSLEQSSSIAGDTQPNSDVVVPESGEIEDSIEHDLPPSEDAPLATILNPKASPFLPPLRTRRSKAEEDDIEMGEVEESPISTKGKRKIRDEELEEGEASDSSSALSDPPDD